MAVYICVKDDGTIGPVEHSNPWDLIGGSRERDSLISDLMRWNDMISNYSDLVTGHCVNFVKSPLSIMVTYVASLAAFGAIIDQGYQTYSALGKTTEKELSLEVFKLAKRVADFAYQLMKLHVFGGLLDIQLMKIAKSISTSIEDVWDVIEGDRKLMSVEDKRLRTLKIRENNYHFADALVKIGFHALGVMALLSTTIVSTETILLFGAASIVVGLVTKTVTQERVNEESRQAAEKVNRWIEAGKKVI